MPAQPVAARDEGPHVRKTETARYSKDFDKQDAYYRAVLWFYGGTSMSIWLQLNAQTASLADAWRL